MGVFGSDEKIDESPAMPTDVLRFFSGESCWITPTVPLALDGQPSHRGGGADLLDWHPSQPSRRGQERGITHWGETE